MSELVRRGCEYRLDYVPGQPIEHAHVCGKPVYDVLLCSDFTEVRLCLEHWAFAQNVKATRNGTIVMRWNWDEQQDISV